MFPPRRGPVDWDRALHLYRDEGWTFARIASAFGFSSLSISKKLRELGVRRRPVSPLRRGLRGRRLYGQWIGMRQRCRNPEHPSYSNFGGRGVTICEEWESFEVFARWALVHGYRVGHGLDLIDGATRFAPENCRIVPFDAIRAQLPERYPSQMSHLLTAFGETKSIAAWTKDPRCRVRRGMIEHRLQRNLTPEQAIAEPPLSELVLAHAQRRPKRRGRAQRQISDDALRRMHVDEGLTCSTIARRYCISYSGVYERLTRLGIMRSTRVKADLSLDRARLYHAWLHVHRLCKNPKYAGWPAVGGCGIRVDARWAKIDPFLQWARANGEKSGLCMVRIDRAKDFGPDNCEWVTRGEIVARSRRPTGERRPRIRVTAFGETKGPTAWSRDIRCNVTVGTLLRRIRAGFEPELAITKPGATPGRGSEVLITAFGVEKGLAEWIRDKRCKLRSADALQRRLAQGMSPENALRTPPYSRRPVTRHQRGRAATRVRR